MMVNMNNKQRKIAAKIMRRQLQSMPTVLIIQIFASFLLLMIFLPRAIASDEPISCPEARFSDFNEIVIYFPDFINPAVQDAQGYPKELKHKNFADQLQSVIKQNFAACMKTEDGEEKPVSILETLISDTPEDGMKLMEAKKKLTDPKKLIVEIRVFYIQPEANDKGQDGYGEAMFVFYRPGAYSEHLEPLTSGMEVFFPKSHKQLLETQVTKFLKKIRPMLFKSRIPSGPL